MQQERQKVLLNSLVDHLLVNEKVSVVINQLVNLGFTKNELVEDFNFNVNDVDSAWNDSLASIKEYMKECLKKHGYSFTEEELSELTEIYEGCQEWAEEGMLNGTTYEEVDDFVQNSPCVKEVLTDEETEDSIQKYETGYQLTKEDIQEIADLCFEDFGKLHHLWLHKDSVTAVSEEGNEIHIYKFFVTPGYRVISKKNNDDLYIEFMYKKYGKRYIKEYFEMKFHIYDCENRLMQARKNCSFAVEKYQKEHQKQ